MPCGLGLARQLPLRETGSNRKKALFNFIKSLFGAGILSLPNAFHYARVPTAPIMYPIVALIVIITMCMLVMAKHRAEKDYPDIQTYSDVGRAACGKFGLWVVEVQVVLLELAFCAGFVIVGIENVQQVLGGNRWIMVLIITPILILLSWVKKLKDLWVFSLLGLIVYVAGVMGVGMFDAFADWETPPNVTEPPTFSNIALFLGTAVYSLEGVNLVIPIEGSLRKPTHGVFVIAAGMGFYAILCAIFGSVMYAAGRGHCDEITEAFDAGATKKIVQIALVLSLIVTHPLTLYPATELLERSLFKEVHASSQPPSGGPRVYVKLQEGKEGDVGGFDGESPDVRGLPIPMEVERSPAWRRQQRAKYRNPQVVENYGDGDDSHSDDTDGHSSLVLPDPSVPLSRRAIDLLPDEVSDVVETPDGQLVLRSDNEGSDDEGSRTNRSSRGSSNPRTRNDSLGLYSDASQPQADEITEKEDLVPSPGNSLYGTSEHAADMVPHSDPRETKSARRGFCGAIMSVVVANKLEWKIRILRTILVTITTIIGGAFQEFSLFSGLVGSLMLSIVGFIVPPVLYWRLNRDRIGILAKTFSIFCCVLGVVVLVVGSKAAMEKIVEHYSGSGPPPDPSCK